MGEAANGGREKERERERMGGGGGGAGKSKDEAGQKKISCNTSVYIAQITYCLTLSRARSLSLSRALSVVQTDHKPGCLHVCVCISGISDCAYPTKP
jgi:hypothetical protein